MPSTRCSARRFRSATASMTRRSSVSVSSRSARSARTFCVVSETAQNVPRPDRARREPANTRTEPGLLVVSSAVRPRKFTTIAGLTGHRRIDERADVPTESPTRYRRTASRARPGMLGAGISASLSVVQEAQLLAPRDEHRDRTAAEGRRPFAATEARLPAVQAASRTSPESASERPRVHRRPGSRGWVIEPATVILPGLTAEGHSASDAHGGAARDEGLRHSFPATQIGNGALL